MTPNDRPARYLFDGSLNGTDEEFAEAQEKYLQAVIKDRDQLKAQVVKLREALEYYANRSNYEMGQDWVFDGEDETCVDTKSPADMDEGQIARKALAQTNEKG